MKTVPRVAVSGLVVVGILGFVTFIGLDRQRSERARATHMENGKAYAARVLDRLGILPVELSESSGLAVSRTQPGVLWSHNDSGNPPNLYAIDLSGRLLAIIPIANAVNRDWEDVATGPCPTGLSTTRSFERVAQTTDQESEQTISRCLYIADTGDNDRVRETLTIYVVVEPMLAKDARLPTVAARSFSYRYPDEPHDSEALAVLPNGDVTIVSKGRTGTVRFFGVSGVRVARALTSGEVLTVEHWGETGIEPNEGIGRFVTGAALSLDGMTLAVRTYNEVFFYGAVQGDLKGTRWRDLGRPCFLGDAEPQGEAIDYLDEKTLLLTSERVRGVPGAILRLQC